jgi:pilus assembly protein Flp/PilA
MTKHIKSLLIRFKSCDQGATLVEYGIALSIAAAVGAGAFVGLGGKINAKVTAADTALSETPSQ